MPPPEDGRSGVCDYDADGKIIDFCDANIDNRPNGPFLAKNYRSILQVFDEKQSLPLRQRPGCRQLRGDSTMKHTENDNIWLRYQVPFELCFFDVNQCGFCESKGSMEFVDCAALICDRYGHFSNSLTGWNEIKCQYRCSNCSKYTVFIERIFIFVQTGYYELRAGPFNTKNLFEDQNCEWRRCNPCYWLKKEDGASERKCFTWDNTCFCCGEVTKIMKDGSEGYVSGSGQHSSLYGSTFCENATYDTVQQSTIKFFCSFNHKQQKTINSMPTQEWISMTRVINWQDDILNLKLGQSLSFQNITREEFISIFPTILQCCVRVSKIKRTFGNHFNVTVENLLVRQHQRDLPFFLAQMRVINKTN